ncbi:tetratricopeptide repeat protein [Reichenbachiella sp. MALMAid0571]|uniref:tetratricopeptide repeat protein n=1 Tax=Reichenbachiella sp. MALMAid0571 TaxID=3143939 RepID=UPI0032DF8A29
MKKIFLFILIISAASKVVCQKSDDIQLANEYYINGELEKAGDLYKSLSTDPKNISIIHNNYFNLLMDLKEYKTADKYLNRISKIFPQNVYYQIDQGILFKQMGETSQADKLFNNIIEKNKTNEYLIRLASQYFINNRFYEFALKALLVSRTQSKTADKHALELANVYRFMGEKSNMIEEYLIFARQRPSNLAYIKNIFQNLLKEEKDILDLQNILIEKIQKSPNEVMYAELLIWVNLQQKNFYGAFIQARSLDKRLNQEGQKVLEIGKIALQNKSYDDAIKMFQYVVDNSKQENYYLQARRYIVTAREEKVKNIYPIDEMALRQLTNDYQQLVNELGYNTNTLEAYRSKALLHAFYLDEKDTAVAILNEIISIPRVHNQLKSKCKLDLGDIYLLTGESWEATLLYSQVEKTNKDSPLGYTAKLKNAKLNYFKGEFELAKSHLDILKLATTREIANDALSLSLLIQNNTVFDTSDFVMKEYASIELMLFQNKKQEALTALASMLEKYPDHSLVDEIYWKMASINMELGKFDDALNYLDQILTRFDRDILGDDAMFLKGKITEENLKENSIAQEIYKEFLLKYPGSVFTAEARKRFRMLRGDQVF